ncbi:ABC transporter permease [Streptomyces sp. NPDC006632]|uniref:ABC transporter permease n=1 Tax=unclassified Streptomyces TaxID=2593676 RepID=UPI002E1FC2AC
MVAARPPAPGAWSAYRMIAGMWIRSTLTYRASFALMLCANFLVTAFDFVVIALMFSQVRSLGGYSFAEVAFLYGTSTTAFGLTNALLGSIDKLGARIRDGTLDTLLVRPVPVLAQVAADRFGLQRLGRLLQGVMVLAGSLVALDVHWTVLKAALVPVMLLSGTALFCAVFVAGAAFQFWAQDAAEVQSAFTYGGQTLLQYPPTVFAKDMVRGVTFVLPLAFVNWLPGLYVLGRPYPLGVPQWLAFAPPLVAAGCLALAGLAWRTGVRAYRSTGS